MPIIQRVTRGLRDTFRGYSVNESLKTMESAARLSPEERRSIQEQRLSALLCECFEYVEAYRPYRSLRNKAQNYPFEVLSELPVLTRDTYQKDPNVYFNPAVKPGQLTNKRAKMTVGYNYLVSKSAWSADYAAHLWAYSRLGLTYPAKHIELHGYFPKQSITVSPLRKPLRLTIDAFVTETIKTAKRAVIENEFLLFDTHIDVKKLPQYSKTLANPRLDYCVGTASVIAALAGLFDKKNISVEPSYKGLVTTGEMLLPKEREIIQRVFKKPVYSLYDSRDDGLIAFECEHGGMHIIEDNFIVEEIDGGIVITNLHNNAAPRMRYATMETGTLTDEPCACGLTSKRFASLTTQKSPLYNASDDRFIPHRVMEMAAEMYYNIVRFKIKQPDSQHAELVAELRTAAAVDEADAFQTRICLLMPGTLVGMSSSVSK